MRITNRHNLPRTLVNLAERDDYSRGHSRISVTQLIDSPRVAILRRRHDGEIERDVADSLWALIGRALHHVAEAGADEEHIAEERCYAEVDGWIVSGAMDIHMPGGSVGILDYKFTSSYAVLAGKPDWERQLNCYAWLLRQAKGLEAEELKICAMIRDWSRQKAKRDPDYPQVPIQVIDIPLWTPEQQLSYISERVRLHQEAVYSSAFEDDLPPCTDEEMWWRGRKWAVFKEGAKRASALFENQTNAAAAARMVGGRVEERPGTPVRCEGDYCSCSKWCTQYQKWKSGQT